MSDIFHLCLLTIDRCAEIRPCARSPCGKRPGLKFLPGSPLFQHRNVRFRHALCSLQLGLILSHSPALISFSGSATIAILPLTGPCWLMRCASAISVKENMCSTVARTFFSENNRPKSGSFCPSGSRKNHLPVRCAFQLRLLTIPALCRIMSTDGTNGTD